VRLVAEASASMTRSEPAVQRRRLHLGSPSLATRMMLASGALALVIGAVLVGLLLAISALRESTRAESRSKNVSLAAANLEKTVLDLETGLRGYVISGNEAFLSTYQRGRGELRHRIVTFESQAQHDMGQQKRASRLTAQIQSYVENYTEPVIVIAHENLAAARTSVAQDEGRRLVDDIRGAFTQFIDREDAIAATSAETATRRANLAVGLGALGLIVSAAIIILFGAYLARSIAQPVRGVAIGASRLAGGELSLRLREGGPGEVGELTRSFNAMAERLQHGRTELEEQNRKLRASERAKSELVSIVSHEVRTPLASVLGFTSLLLHRDVDDETRRRYLEIIDAQGRRLSALLDDFLDVQRLEEGRLELGSERVDMAALLAEQVQLFEAQSEAHRLELRVTETPLAVRGDSNRLAQVVGNLLSNAIKYSPEGGVVHVRGERANSSVRVVVEDEGLGIPRAQQARIFTKFYRGEAATSGIAGSGLGLAFARAVIEAHGGKIGFTSAEGEGSTFFLELPTAA
jgi:signal transduction histidine kinase